VSRFRRLLKRPSLRLARSILIPLTAIHVAVTLYALVVTNQASVSIAFDRVEGIVEALATTEASDDPGFSRIASNLGADRVWLVSATGRILASNRAGEVDGLVDDIWWQNLPVTERRFRRLANWGGREYVQVAYHDIERGLWSMIIASVESQAGPWSARILAILILSGSVWMLMLGSVVAVVQRRLGKSLDASDMVARRALQGEAVSMASLARTQKFGPGVRTLELVGKMQEQASRANEAESRFSLTVELLPGLAYLASYEGKLLYAGPLMRQRLGGESWMGRSVTGPFREIPFDRVHAAASRSQTRGVTFDHLPIREESGDEPGMMVSVRSVLFKGVPAYLAHIESINDAGIRTPPRPSPAHIGIHFELVERAQEIIIAFDAATRTLVWNEAATRLSGVAGDDIPDLKTAIKSLTLDDEAVSSFAEWMDGAPEEAPLVLKFVSRDGTRYTISWTARELKGNGQTLGGALFGTAMPVESVRARRNKPQRRLSRGRRKRKNAGRSA